jgi:hypothetical protein
MAQQPQMSELEQLRAARIAENARRLQTVMEGVDTDLLIK